MECHRNNDNLLRKIHSGAGQLVKELQKSRSSVASLPYGLGHFLAYLCPYLPALEERQSF